MSAVGLLGLQVRLRDGLGTYFDRFGVVVNVFTAILSSFCIFVYLIGVYFEGLGNPQISDFHEEGRRF